ncbi:MAG TPA: hypothetical protein VF712_01795 [Thermoleophilaceae bacterium]|jgi:hypothetical protein
MVSGPNPPESERDAILAEAARSRAADAEREREAREGALEQELLAEETLSELRRIRRAFRAQFAFYGIVITLILLWLAAETHDNNCYSLAQSNALKAIGEDREPEKTECLILPWNEPE